MCIFKANTADVLHSHIKKAHLNMSKMPNKEERIHEQLSLVDCKNMKRCPHCDFFADKSSKLRQHIFYKHLPDEITRLNHVPIATTVLRKNLLYKDT